MLKIKKLLLILIISTLMLTSCATSSAPVASDAVKKENINILVAGSDRTSGLYDVLMLVSVDRENSQIWTMQIPRDTYAAYTDSSYRKLNGAISSLGGMEQFCKFMSSALGVRIDRYVSLTPDAFVKSVDALGGVEIELPRAMKYSDPAQGLYIDLPAGKQTLDGKTAEQFVRYRSGYVTGDIGRLDAQKLFLSALFCKARQVDSVWTLVRLGVSLLPEMNTDMTSADVLSLAKLLREIESDNVFFVTAPGAEAKEPTSGASYYVLSASATAELIEGHFGSVGEFDKSKVFLKEEYARFRNIYNGYSNYTVHSASENGKTEEMDS